MTPKDKIVVTAPDYPGSFEYRIYHFVEKTFVKKLPFTVKVPVPEKPIIVSRQPAPSIPPDTITVPVQDQSIPIPPDTITVPVQDQSIPILPDTITVPVQDQSIPLDYSSWENFFESCQESIPQVYHSGYCALLKVHKVPIESLKFFDYPLLTLLGITLPFHQITIMEKVYTIRKEESNQNLRKIIIEEIKKFH